MTNPIRRTSARVNRAPPRLGLPRGGLGFASMRRLCALLALAVVTAGLGNAALAAGLAPTASSCTIAPKQAWTVCPRADLAGRKLVRRDLRNANWPAPI